MWRIHVTSLKMREICVGKSFSLMQNFSLCEFPLYFMHTILQNKGKYQHINAVN